MFFSLPKSASLASMESLILWAFMNIKGRNLTVIEIIRAMFLGLKLISFRGLNNFSIAITNSDMVVVYAKANEIIISIKNRHKVMRPCLIWFLENNRYMVNINMKT